MKTYQSSAICPKCGELLRTNNTKSYNFYCHNCNGRFRSNSIKDSDDELFRISIPATADEYEVHNEPLLEITEVEHYGTKESLDKRLSFIFERKIHSINRT